MILSSGELMKQSLIRILLLFLVPLFLSICLVFSCKKYNDDDDDAKNSIIKVSLSTKITASPSNIVAVQDSTKSNAVTITWNKAECEAGISYYRVYYAESEALLKKSKLYVGETAETSLTGVLPLPFDEDGELIPTKKYYFLVKAYTKTDVAQSGNTSCEIAFSKLAYPTKLKHLRPSATTHSFSWKAVDSADEYIIYGQYSINENTTKVEIISQGPETKVSFTSKTDYTAFKICAGQTIKSSDGNGYYVGNLSSFAVFP